MLLLLSFQYLTDERFYLEQGFFRIVLPLMLASILSYIVVLYVNKRTVYAQALLKEGIDVTDRPVTGWSTADWADWSAAGWLVAAGIDRINTAPINAALRSNCLIQPPGCIIR